MRLAEMLRLYIAANNLEQKAVAQEIGISESTLSRFLGGTNTPDGVGFMRVVAWATGVEMPKSDEFERRLKNVEQLAATKAADANPVYGPGPGGRW